MPAGTGSTIGSGLGTAVGSIWGPVGASVGGAIGGMAGSIFDGSPKTPDMPTPVGVQAPTPYGAFTGSQGGYYMDPVTGRQVYTSTVPSFTANDYRTAMMMDQLLGGNTAKLQLDQAIAGLKNQMAGLDVRKPSASDFGLKTDANGNLIAPNASLSADNPWWIEYQRLFHNEWGGKHYRSKDVNSGFAKWLADVNKQAYVPASRSFADAMKNYEGNVASAKKQKAALQAQMESLLGMQGSAGTGASSTPMMNWLTSGAQLGAQNAALQTQAKNALLAQQQAAAKRGMGTSSMSDLGRMQTNLALGQGMGQNLLNAGNASFANTQNLLGYLQGQQQLSNAQANANRGLGLQEWGIGSGLGKSYADGLTAANAANVGMTNQWQMGNYGQPLNNQMAQQTQQNGMAGILGGALGQIDLSGMFGAKTGTGSWGTSSSLTNAPTNMFSTARDYSGLTSLGSPQVNPSYTPSTANFQISTTGRR